MSDIFSIIQSSYSTASLSTPSNTPYKNVDPVSYQGNWQGTYPDSSKFSVSVSDVQGFRAQVKYQSGSTVKYQSVLIKDSSFRVGDSKFTLTGNGAAQVKTAVTDPVTGSTSLISGSATLDK